MASRWARVARGLLAAVFSTLVAGISHSLAGGHLSVLGLVVATAFAAIVCVALAGRRLSRVRLAASVGVSQLAFHLLFGALGTGATITSSGHHAMAATITADAAHDHTMASWMWVAHAIAALVTVLLLRHGEAAFWRLLELVLLAIAAWRVPVLSPRPIAHAAATGRPVAPRLFLLRRAALRFRGPPTVRFV